jgi:hypothetical protein
MKNSYRNPFGGVNASQLDPDLILEYWCNPFHYKLFSEIKEDDIYIDINNIVFMGGRSTGKSMFLRYWSYPVQLKRAEKKEITFWKVIQSKSGIGFYLRIDGPKLRSFQGHGLSQDHWTFLFTHYFELLIGREYIEVLNVLHKEKSLDDKTISQQLIPGICELLGVNSCITFENILYEFDLRIREVEIYLGNVPFRKKEFIPKDRGFFSQSLSFGIPNLLQCKVSSFEKINMVILLDEYENFSDYQQKVVNTLLRFTKSYIKFRIGMRLKGFRTFKMISVDDFIKEGREYRKVVFEEIINKESGYNKFLCEISKKRLESIPALKNKGFTNIKKILGRIENSENEAIEIVKTNPNKIYEYFKKKINKENLDKVRYSKNPLLELMNFIWLTRGVSAEKTAKSMDDYLNNVKNSQDGKKYHSDYINKYKLTLNFLLCSIYKKNKQYYSFNTFAFLSSGIVGHFIELCRRSFAIAEWEDMDSLLSEGQISIKSQHKAATDFSISEKQQIGRIPISGVLLSNFIDNLGNIFREYHLDFKMRYPETNQFAINVDTVKNSNLKDALKDAIKWTVIQKKPKIQRSSPSGNLQDIYIFNRIYSPSFQISYRTRGGESIELNEHLIKILMSSARVNISNFLPKDDGYNLPIPFPNI